MISMHTSPLAALGRTRDAGGMNAYIRGLARELGRGGMYVDIFTRRADPSTPIIQFLSDQVRLITLPAGPAIPLPPNELFPYVREFTRQIEHFAAGREHGYNLLHSHYWLSADAALPLAAAWDVPHVTMFHTVERLKHEQYTLREDDSPAARIRIEQERRIAQSVDAIVVSTEHERERLRSLYCLPASRLHVIPCGVDLITFEPGSPTARAEARARLHADERPMLLFVGRLDSIKDLDLLLTGLSRMCEKAVLHIVGGMAQGDPEVERLRALSAKLGVAERVRFPGAAPQSELPAWYRAADALIISSRYESFGLVAVEALATGTPVVASAAGGLPSIVRDGVNGLLVPWRTPEAFAERLDLLLSDDTLRERLSAQARASVARLAWPHIGDAMRALFGELSAEAYEAVACCCF